MGVLSRGREMGPVLKTSSHIHLSERSIDELPNPTKNTAKKERWGRASSVSGRDIEDFVDEYGSDLSPEQKSVFEAVLKGYVRRSGAFSAIERVLHRRRGDGKELSSPNRDRGAPTAAGQRQGVRDGVYGHRGVQRRRHHDPLLRRLGHHESGREPDAAEDTTERGGGGAMEGVPGADHRRDIDVGRTTV